MNIIKKKKVVKVQLKGQGTGYSALDKEFIRFIEERGITPLRRESGLIRHTSWQYETYVFGKRYFQKFEEDLRKVLDEREKELNIRREVDFYIEQLFSYVIRYARREGIGNEEEIEKEIKEWGLSPLTIKIIKLLSEYPEEAADDIVKQLVKRAIIDGRYKKNEDWEVALCGRRWSFVEDEHWIYKVIKEDCRKEILPKYQEFRRYLGDFYFGSELSSASIDEQKEALKRWGEAAKKLREVLGKSVGIYPDCIYLGKCSEENLKKAREAVKVFGMSVIPMPQYKDQFIVVIQ